MNKKVEYFKYCLFFQEQRVPNRIEQRLKQNWTSRTPMNVWTKQKQIIFG